MSALVCLVTAPVDRAAEIAHALVQSRTAACVNVVPAVRSFYRWESEIQDEEESLLIVKTTDEHLEALDAQLADIHPYETYELIALPVEGGNWSYLDWLAGAVG